MHYIGYTNLVSVVILVYSYAYFILKNRSLNISLAMSLTAKEYCSPWGRYGVTLWSQSLESSGVLSYVLGTYILLIICWFMMLVYLKRTKLYSPAMEVGIQYLY